MATRTRVREINIKQDSGTFSTFFKKFSSSHSDFDFEGLSAVRKLLSNEKAKILNVIKTSKPESIYKLSKILRRDFKAVRDDVWLLKRFGFIELVTKTDGRRKSLTPKVVTSEIIIKVNV